MDTGDFILEALKIACPMCRKGIKLEWGRERGIGHYKCLHLISVATNYDVPCRSQFLANLYCKYSKRVFVSFNEDAYIRG